jgi:hypothetical protein
MFDNVNYQFSDIEDILMFVNWLTETFDGPEEFEEWLRERLPMIDTADDEHAISILINPCAFIDDDQLEAVYAEAEFWDIIHREYHHEDDTNEPTVPNSD